MAEERPILKTAKWQNYESVWEHSKASGNDLLLLLVLIKFRQSKTFATKETIALKMRCNVDTVDRCLKRLKRLGELDWDKGSAKSQRANSYRILLPGLDLDTPANSPAVSSSIPPQTRAEYPRNITPPNISKQNLNIYIENMIFGDEKWVELSTEIAKQLGLSVLQVRESLDRFKASPVFTAAKSEREKCWRWFNWLLAEKNEGR